jgi:hypothetical protein
VTVRPRSAIARGANQEGTEDMADHKHGEMNTDVQVKTFDGFMKFTTWSVIVIFAILIFMAIFTV